MSEVDNLIAEIATVHGIAVDRHDPIMILNTISKRLREDSKKDQEETLNAFKQQLEITSHQWGKDAKNKAEKILNASLDASKKQISTQVENISKESASAAKAEMMKVAQQMHSSINNTKHLAYLSIGASFITLIAATIVLLSTM